MKILITGATGFIGINFINLSPEFQIQTINLRLIDVDKIDFTGYDTVLHLAALVHQMKGAPESEYFKVNTELTLKIAEKAKKQGVSQFVFLSSVKVFGESTTNQPPWNENSICKPMDAYGKSKLEAEHKLQLIATETFNVAIVRSPLVYGAGVKANMYKFVTLVDQFPMLPLGNINNKRSMVFVGNLVSIIKAIINQKASGVFVASDIKPLSTTDLLVYIAKSLHKKIYLFPTPKLILKIASKIKPNIIDRLYGSLELDSSLTFQKLQFTPPYTNEEGISEMTQWYQNKKKR